MAVFAALKYFGANSKGALFNWKRQPLIVCQLQVHSVVTLFLLLVVSPGFSEANLAFEMLSIFFKLICLTFQGRVRAWWTPSCDILSRFRKKKVLHIFVWACWNIHNNRLLPLLQLTVCSQFLDTLHTHRLLKLCVYTTLFFGQAIFISCMTSKSNDQLLMSVPSKETKR